jgi:hypothetical protein
MKLTALLFTGILILAVTAVAQVELVSDNYFPSDLEFRELQKLISEEVLESTSRLSKVDGGNLISSIGFNKYRRRTYSNQGAVSVTIEAVTFQDTRAAYSILTLLRKSDLLEGPPGDAMSLTPDSICFAHGREWARIQGRGVTQDFLKQVAVSVSNRIGSIHPKVPSLVSHLPKLGYDAASLRFFSGLKAYEAYSKSIGGPYLKLDLDLEIAQARYRMGNQTGMLCLLSFPTTGVAEEYFAAPVLFKSINSDGNGSLYTKEAGPLVAILSGDFDAASAEKILSYLKYSYSIRWVYDKRNQLKTVWGIPTRILGTVVDALLFVALLCVVSLVVGSGFAVFRFMFRGYVSKKSVQQTEQDEIIRLRLR